MVLLTEIPSCNTNLQVIIKYSYCFSVEESRKEILKKYCQESG